MPTYNDYGIVLNKSTLGEADKILNIYTKENGLVRAIGKGTRKLTSKLSSKLDQLSCCYFQFAVGKNLDVICECEQVTGFSKLRSDLTRLSYGILFLEVVHRFAHEKETESKSIYELLYSCLTELEEVKEVELVAVQFLLDFLFLHGYKPRLESCVACSTNIDKKEKFYSFSSILGGVLCSNCSNSIEHKQLNANVVNIIRSPFSLHPKFNPTEIHLALDLLREHLNIRAKNKVRSFDLILSL